MADGRYGSDGHGPPPSREVVRAVAPFFSDQPTPLDPERVKKIGAQVRDREASISWNRYKRK